MGTLIAPVGIYLRRHIVEEPQVAGTGARSWRAVDVRNWFLVIFSIMGMTVASYLLMYYRRPIASSTSSCPRSCRCWWGAGRARCR